LNLHWGSANLCPDAPCYLRRGLVPDLSSLHHLLISRDTLGQLALTLQAPPYSRPSRRSATLLEWYCLLSPLGRRLDNPTSFPRRLTDFEAAPFAVSARSRSFVLRCHCFVAGPKYAQLMSFHSTSHAPQRLPGSSLHNKPLFLPPTLQFRSVRQPTLSRIAPLTSSAFWRFVGPHTAKRTLPQLSACPTFPCWNDLPGPPPPDPFFFLYSRPANRSQPHYLAPEFAAALLSIHGCSVFFFFFFFGTLTRFTNLLFVESSSVLLSPLPQNSSRPVCP